MTFRPPLWAWAALLAALSILGSLGIWQLQRAQEKERMLAQHRAVSKNPAPALASFSHPGDHYHSAVKATGHYRQGRQILLDNQTWKHRAGYRVWTPLQLDDGRLVLVDRGWVALGADRAHPPSPAAPTGRRTVRGFWRAWPKPGLRLGGGRNPCNRSKWPRVLEYPQYAQVACQYHAPVCNGLLLLDEHTPGGFPRNWADVGLPPIRHIGYAIQWFAMALAVLIIFLVRNLKKKA